DLNRFGYLLALSGNESHNALVATDLAPEMGRAAIFQVNARGKDEEGRQALSYTLQGRTFLHSGAPLDEMLRRHYGGWVYQRTKLSEEYPPDRYKHDLDPSAEIILVVRKGALAFSSREAPLKLEIGDTVLAYIPKPDPAKAAKGERADEESEKTDADAPSDAIPVRNPAV
ncbi:MAG: hypothetical protein ACX939_07175, partial [Hyphococcus sp.]